MNPTQDANMPPVDGRPIVLGFPQMDLIHEELYELLKRSRAPGKIDWLQLLGEIDKHLRSHFSEEDRWMLETEFPSRECHMNEHADVLLSSSQVLELARQGDLRHAAGFVAELSTWFPAHADYLDSALAAWMCKLRYGGKPVVLHRTQPPAATT